MAIHFADGFHFRANDDGSVTIVVGYAPYDDDGFPTNPTDSTTIDANDWKAVKALGAKKAK